jgi:hypothetical protein
MRKLLPKFRHQVQLVVVVRYVATVQCPPRNACQNASTMNTLLHEIPAWAVVKVVVFESKTVTCEMIESVTNVIASRPNAISVNQMLRKIPTISVNVTRTTALLKVVCSVNSVTTNARSVKARQTTCARNVRQMPIW